MSVNLQGLNQDLLEFVLEHPYQCFQVNTDINQVIKNTTALLKTKNIEFKAEDISSTLETLKKSLQSRKGLNKATHQAIKPAKFMWAKHVCNHFTIRSMNELDELCRNVWGSRLPDIYRKTLKSYYDAESHVDSDKLLSELLGEDVQTVVPPHLTPLKGRVEVGDIKITMGTGTLTFKTLEASNLKKVENSKKISIGRVEDGLLFDVVIDF
jgi:hypothetical protein